MTEPKLITGTPYQREDVGEMAAPFALWYGKKQQWDEPTVTLAISTASKPDDVKIRRRDMTLESFYELREAVNDLYAHIRQETPTD